jgi:CRISPR/Cas system CSM-associated protein Csm2 small subunit
MERKNGDRKKKPLGEILLEKYIITHEMLDFALELQKKEKGKYLGQIFLEMGVSQDQLNEILDYFQHRKKIGDILIEDKVILPAQLKEALERQREKEKFYKPLGRILMDLGYIDYDQYINALAKHFLMQIVSLKIFQPSKSLQKVIGEVYAKKNKIVVLEDGIGKLKLAFAEPSSALMEEIRRFARLKKKIEFYLAKSSEIDPFLEKLSPDLPN